MAMLINSYELEIYTPPCEPGAERYVARARIQADISEVLPYLNATLRGAVYYGEAQALTWKKGGHSVALHAHEIAVSNVEDRQAGAKELDGLIALVNRTWDKREEIAPDHTTRRRPPPMRVYNLLPRTNCRRCGEPTCHVFGLKLLAGQREIEDCPELLVPERADQLAALRQMLDGSPAIGPRSVASSGR
jgi:ArsR family metal-binding transcriptional regulator